MGDHVFKLVFVCTGNRCRSPYAAKRAETATSGLAVQVASAGTLDAPGHRSPPELTDLARKRLIDLGTHRAVPIASGSLADADLVLGFGFNHVASSVVDGGAERSKTFTLPELARLLREVEPPDDLDPVMRAREQVRRAHAARAGSGPSREEVRDPFGGPASAYAEMADEIDDLLEVVLARLFGRATKPQ